MIPLRVTMSGWMRYREQQTADFSGARLLSICGENGAGKSTLMKILSGVHPHGSYSGEVVFDGEECRFAGIRDSEARGIVIIHQELALVPQLSIAENLFLGNEVAHHRMIDWNRTNHEAEKHLRRVGLYENPTTPAGVLGVGKQQLVEIAKALSRDSRILVLDEPSAALGRRDLEHLFRVITHLKAQGVAIVYISHRLEEVFEIADRVTVLKDGRLVGSWPTSAVTMPNLVRAMTGRELGMVTAGTHDAAAPVRLDVRRLGRHGVFDDISLTLRAGEIVGIAGLVGSGRTELLRAIFGADQPDSGEIVVDGVPVRFRSPAQALRRGLGLLPEDRKSQGLLLDRALRENVALASLRRFTCFGILHPKWEERAVRGLMADLHIVARGPGQPVVTLSGGNQQKVVLARWLARKCGILLFDEPTRGVDVGAKEEIYRLMQVLAAQGAAVLVVSSELKELFAICPRILVMREGRLVGEFSGPSLREEDVVDAMLIGGGSDASPAVAAG